MIGGSGSAANHERLYEINFPERPRALAEFLHSIGQSFNICLFHYRGQGGDTGKVFIGFEADSVQALEKLLKATGYEFARVQSAGAAIFLA